MASIAVVILGLGISLSFNRGQPDLGLSADEELKLAELSRMFGQDSVQYGMKSLIIDRHPVEQVQLTVAESLEQIRYAVDTLGIDPDLSKPPAPTGDALFDAYAAEVDRLICTYRPRKGGYDPGSCAVIPERTLDAWEERFGNDSRYWELRYLTVYMQAGHSEHGVLQMSEEDYTRAMGYLEEARSREIASANTLLLLYRETVAANSRALESLSDYVGASGYVMPSTELELTERPAFTGEQISRSIALQREAEAAGIELLNAAVTAGPDEAWPLYLRGIQYLSLGEPEAGLADLRSGNVAPLNSYPRPFPMTLVGDTLATAEPAGGPVVSGVFLLQTMSYPWPDYIGIKMHLREVELLINLGLDLDALDAWHGFACRFGAAWPDLSSQYMNGFSQINIVRDTMLATHGTDLSPTQRDTLDRINGVSGVLRARFRSRYRYYDYMETFYVAALAGGTRGLPVAYYLQEALETKIVTETIDPIMMELAQISYPGLDTPEAMFKYEVLTDEESVARMNCRNAARVVDEVIDHANARVRGQQVIAGLDDDDDGETEPE